MGTSPGLGFPAPPSDISPQDVHLAAMSKGATELGLEAPKEEDGFIGRVGVCFLTQLEGGSWTLFSSSRQPLDLGKTFSYRTSSPQPQAPNITSSQPLSFCLLLTSQCPAPGSKADQSQPLPLFLLTPAPVLQCQLQSSPPSPARAYLWSRVEPTAGWSSRIRELAGLLPCSPTKLVLLLL